MIEGLCIFSLCLSGMIAVVYVALNHAAYHADMKRARRWEERGR